MDETTTVKQWLNQEREAGTDCLHLERMVNYTAGNVQSTDQYWASTLRNFEATALFQSHIMNKESSFFMTLSIAEFHDPFLQRVLLQYVSKVESFDAGEAVLETDKAFYAAVNKYKNVVMHYFQCKVETWVSSFLRPVLGLVDLRLTTEWAKACRAIHDHFQTVTDSNADKKLSEAMNKYLEEVFAAMLALDDYLMQVSNLRHDCSLESYLFNDGSPCDPEWSILGERPDGFV
jgi:hypothetical protein